MLNTQPGEKPIPICTFRPFSSEFVVLRLKGGCYAPCIPTSSPVALGVAVATRPAVAPWFAAPPWPPVRPVPSLTAKVSFPCLGSLPASPWPATIPGVDPGVAFCFLLLGSRRQPPPRWAHPGTCAVSSVVAPVVVVVAVERARRS